MKYIQFVLEDKDWAAITAIRGKMSWQEFAKSIIAEKTTQV